MSGKAARCTARQLPNISAARARSGTSYGERDSSAIPRASARDGSAAPPTATQSTARIPQAQSQSMFRSLPSPVTTTPATSPRVFRAGIAPPSDNCLHSCIARKPVRGIDLHRGPLAYAAQKSGSRRRSGSYTGIDKAVVLSPPLLPCRALSAFFGLAWTLLLSIQNQFICWPPFTARLAPVMKPASSEHRNATSAATSSGLPRRPAGICGRIFVSRISCGIAVTIFVAR